jgi:hypothetical protein
MHVRKAPSSALSPVHLEDVPDPDGVNRWVDILASLVTRLSQTRSRDPGTRYPRPADPDDTSSRQADSGS